jgi:hypothetical protein
MHFIGNDYLFCVKVMNLTSSLLKCLASQVSLKLTIDNVTVPIDITDNSFFFSHDIKISKPETETNYNCDGKSPNVHVQLDYINSICQPPMKHCSSFSLSPDTAWKFICLNVSVPSSLKNAFNIANQPKEAAAVLTQENKLDTQFNIELINLSFLLIDLKTMPVNKSVLLSSLCRETKLNIDNLEVVSCYCLV